MTKLLSLHFNSTLVRLKECSFTHLFQSLNHFNSTLVRLKAVLSNKSPNLNSYFNSTLVRLKARIIPAVRGIYLFQFHIGAIKRENPCPASTSLLPFQFHIGAIKSTTLSTGCVLLKNFNSTLVRLKAYQENTLLRATRISIPHWCD